MDGDNKKWGCWGGYVRIDEIRNEDICQKIGVCTSKRKDEST